VTIFTPGAPLAYIIEGGDLTRGYRWMDTEHGYGCIEFYRAGFSREAAGQRYGIEA
jgi:hypothetical protein